MTTSKLIAYIKFNEKKKKKTELKFYMWYLNFNQQQILVIQ